MLRVIVQRLTETTSPNGVLPFGSLWGAGAFTPGEGKNQSASPHMVYTKFCKEDKRKMDHDPNIKKNIQIKQAECLSFSCRGRDPRS